MNLGEKLKQVRIERGLTLKEVSSALDISVASLHYYENNVINIPWGKLYSLLDFYHLNPYLFVQEGEEYLRITDYSPIAKMKVYAIDEEERKK